DRLGKHCGRAGSGHSVQRLTPPIVCGNLQGWDSAGLVYELRCLLLQGHSLNQIVDPLADWQGRVQVKREVGMVRSLRNRAGCCYKERYYKERGREEYDSRPAGLGHTELSSQNLLSLDQAASATQYSTVNVHED